MARNEVITRREMLFAALLWLVVLVANLATVTRSPTAWHDEVYFADPAIHFAAGDGFRTTAWTLVGEHVFWPGLVPAYGFALGGWLKIMGVGLWQVRVLPILMAACAAGWIWWTARRRGHARSSGVGLLLLGALLCAAGVVFSYRSGRGDALAMLWWAANYAVLAADRGRERLVAFFFLGAAAPWCGLFLGPYLAVVGVFLVFLLGRGWIGPVAMAWTGFGVGAVSMVGFYRATGSWESFVLCSRLYQNGIFSPHFQFRLDGFRDPSLLLVCLGLGVAALFFRGRPGGRRIAVLALMGILTVGVLQALLGKWPSYYSWLAFFPAVLSLAQLMSVDGPSLARGAAIICTAGAIVAGAPARLCVCVLEWGERDYRRVEMFVAGKFHGGDRVLCDPSAYFALRPIAGGVYPRASDMVAEIPDDVRRSITAACVRPEVDAGSLASILGGKWVSLGSLGDGADRMPFGAAAPYRLVAYRRAE
ncbi:MAG TPA: hypothetical protein PLU30_18760 [Verrucomicrobiae bacterium]|nr:hypothetical protein [Verrucomicrobiae bacterium]